jgi:hypothetical protein
MGPKVTPAKQKNTLFSYFAKGSTPKEKEGDQNTGDVLAPKKSPNKAKVSPSAQPPHKIGKDKSLNYRRMP